ncbi:hypothetical protein SAMN05216223_108332 [Actinacidiphila yanglinensis]|uniref:N-acetyltransferase domain-containing protein n=1 Tax=Actinacidiphila yanglinensis TaxID=310779 RepID=A0A1H6CE21_9ACTN|nr:GNAT family N-acetyltransferase [Actinacidiphila yanglinensis]SEG71037.1 hypothetical protein SAMN05216223_108332 [Actinacidiphila yanglinensis]
MATFEISTAGADELRTFADWADDEQWNPGLSDGEAFYPTDPHGFLLGRLDGRAVASVSAVRYGLDHGFLGFYIAREPVRGQGYGLRMWNAAMDRLDGRNVGLDGVVSQQDNYRKSGFRRAWNHIRYEGVPSGEQAPAGVTLVDAGTLPFARLAGYDRRFFPAARDVFLAAWIGLPGHTALAAVRDGELCGFGVRRPARSAARVGPLYAASPDIAHALLGALAATAPGLPVAVDVPDVNPAATALVERLGLRPTFETARMYTGPTPAIDIAGIFGNTTLELG